MSMIYNLKHWIDHVVETPYKRRFVDNKDGTYNEEKVPGKIIRQGTPRNAENYNNMEEGIYNNSVYTTFLLQNALQQNRAIGDLQGESKELSLNNNNQYPFYSAAKTVALTNKRGSVNYYVHIEILSESGGFVDEVEIFDKQINGFKIRFNGSAKAAQIKYTVVGGLK